MATVGVKNGPFAAQCFGGRIMWRKQKTALFWKNLFFNDGITRLSQQDLRLFQDSFKLLLTINSAK